MRQFISVHDVQDVALLAQEGIALKADPYAHELLGRRKTLGLLFFNPSLRTRLSTQKAARNLGMEVMVMNVDSDGWKLETEEGVVMDGDKAEHLKDAAAVISQYCDIIGVRSFPGLKDKEADYRDKVLYDMARWASAPIVNLESAIRHPLQSLADLMTIREHQTKARPKVVLTWAPHPKALPQAVPNSFAEWMNRADVELTIACPPGYELDAAFAGHAHVTHDQNAALDGADFVYAKNWSATHPYGQILSKDMSWTVTPEKMALTDNGKLMHCLPVRRNMVVSDAVLDGHNSLILPEANNRTYAAQAVLKRLLENL